MRVSKGMIELCECTAVSSFFPSPCSTGSQLWYLCICIYRCGHAFLNPASVKAQLHRDYVSVPLVIIYAYVATPQL